MNYIEEYYNKIKSGKIVACKKVIKTYEQQMEILKGDKYIYDAAKAQRVIDFKEKFCRHSKGKWAGKPVKLELWQKARIAVKYGIVHKETGLRKYRVTFTVVARKNGKSFEGSSDQLYMTVADGEQGAEIYSVATKKDQAKIIFEEAHRMVSQSKMLSKHFRKRKSDLYFPMTFSKVQPLSSDSNSLDGLNAHYWIIDECHAIKDRNLYDVMISSTGSREQPMGDIITTAGFVRESLFDNLYDYSEKILDGVIEDETFFPLIYELDDRKEWTNPKMWIKANPNLGVSKSIDYMKQEFERARNNPQEVPNFLTKHCNIRESSVDRWVDFETIEKNNETYDIEKLRNSYCVVGVDLSKTTDLTCATFIFLLEDDKKFVHQQYFIAREQAEKREAEDRVPYSIWHENGYITFTNGASVDYSDVTNWIKDTVKKYNLTVFDVGYDNWNAAYWVKEMEDVGFDMLVVRQGYKTFSQPMKNLEADFLNGKIIFNNNPILKWCINNVNVERDKNENVRPVKNNRKQRIDGFVSMLIAYVAMDENMDNFKYVQN